MASDDVWFTDGLLYIHLNGLSLPSCATAGPIPNDMCRAIAINVMSWIWRRIDISFTSIKIANQETSTQLLLVTVGRQYFAHNAGCHCERRA
jgi:hypothetical protein